MLISALGLGPMPFLERWVILCDLHMLAILTVQNSINQSYPISLLSLPHSYIAAHTWRHAGIITVKPFKCCVNHPLTPAFFLLD